VDRAVGLFANREDEPVKVVTITIPKRIDDELHRFLNEEVVRIEASASRSDEEDQNVLKRIKRLRDGYDGASRRPVVVVHAPEKGAMEIIQPKNTQMILIDWREINDSSSVTLIQNLIEDIQNLPGLDDNEELKDILSDLRRKRDELANE
jgi:hypothetical protein